MSVEKTASEVPAWRRRTEGEHRWPAALTVLITITLQLLLPDRLVLGPRWLLPALSVLLLIALLFINPGRVVLHDKRGRLIALVLVAVVSIGNGGSAVELVVRILDGSIGDKAGPLLASGFVVWATNIVAFSLWYWEFDGGGPAARACAHRDHPDFAFPQMQNPELAHKDWEPYYVDYLYMAFTNATAFSPTDVMPLRRWAKLTMMAQSGISLALALLVIARAVGILH